MGVTLWRSFGCSSIFSHVLDVISIRLAETSGKRFLLVGNLSPHRLHRLRCVCYSEDPAGLALDSRLGKLNFFKRFQGSWSVFNFFHLESPKVAHSRHRLVVSLFVHNAIHPRSRGLAKLISFVLSLSISLCYAGFHLAPYELSPFILKERMLYSFCPWYLLETPLDACS